MALIRIKSSSHHSNEGTCLPGQHCGSLMCFNRSLDNSVAPTTQRNGLQLGEIIVGFALLILLTVRKLNRH